MGYMIKGWCFVALVAVLGYLYRDTFDPASLANARVLVTGASTGIGEEMAYHYARAGAELVLTARREHALVKVRNKCLELGAKRVSLLPADMSSSEARERVVEQAVSEMGGLDYLVLNHIGSSPFEMWEGDVNHTQWLMEVNFISYIHLATRTLPLLAESKGSIIVLSSLTGKIATPYTTSYSASKFALDGFFGSLRHELAMKKVPVSITLCILGLIDTESALEKIKIARMGSRNSPTVRRSLNGVAVEHAPAAPFNVYGADGNIRVQRWATFVSPIDFEWSGRDKISMPAYPARDAAFAVISAGTSRLQEMYYPWYVRPVCFFRDWFPQSRDWMIQMSYQYKPEEPRVPS